MVFDGIVKLLKYNKRKNFEYFLNLHLKSHFDTHKGLLLLLRCNIHKYSRNSHYKNSSFKTRDFKLKRN